MKRRHLLACSLLPALLAAPAGAQLPTDRGPLRLVVGFPAGGSADVLARTIADKLKTELGLPVVVDNRAGAGGIIAADYVKGQPGDGLTVLLGTTHMMVMAPLTTKNVRYDGVKDFKPVARLSSFHECIAVPIQSPANSVPQWLELARKDNQHASYGVPAPGSFPQFVGYQLGVSTGTQLLAVPYRGAAPVTQDLLGGQLAAGIIPIADMAQHQGKRIKILAVNGTQRSPQLPDVPTLKELGYPQFDQLEWAGLFMPTATPDAIVQQLQAATLKVTALPDVREALLKMGTAPDPAPGAALTEAITKDLAQWGPVVKASGFAAQ